ncbi:hypothetical protein B0H12DRAFT_1098428 [Mycena haematopus]|nr:hypothetical protein B0H12DRAFT_1098428 [Mycena haematopus]
MARYNMVVTRRTWISKQICYTLASVATKLEVRNPIRVGNIIHQYQSAHARGRDFKQPRCENFRTCSEH